MTKLRSISKDGLKEEKMNLEEVLLGLRNVDTTDSSKQKGYLKLKDETERRLAEIAVELIQLERLEVKEFLKNLDKEGSGSR